MGIRGLSSLLVVSLAEMPLTVSTTHNSDDAVHVRNLSSGYSWTTVKLSSYPMGKVCFYSLVASLIEVPLTVSTTHSDGDGPSAPVSAPVAFSLHTRHTCPRR